MKPTRMYFISVGIATFQASNKIFFQIRALEAFAMINAREVGTSEMFHHRAGPPIVYCWQHNMQCIFNDCKKYRNNRVHEGVVQVPAVVPVGRRNTYATFNHCRRTKKLGEDDHGILVEWRKNPTDKH
jgi:hypothetical protein